MTTSTGSLTPTVVRTSRGLSIAGTRITLYSILDYVHAGWPAKLIRDRFNLTDQQVGDVLAYIETHTDAVEAEYQDVVREAEANRQYWEERLRERLANTPVVPTKPEYAQLAARLAAYKAKHQPS